MTSDKVRYFQTNTGSVVRVRGDELIRLYEEDPASTEVQVVPLDAIVIRREELPEVSRGERMLRLNGTTPVPYTTADQHRSDALTHLALAEYLREHPPVDEEQVKALNEIYEDWSQPHNYGIPFGQYLVERGVRVEAKP